MLRKYEKLILGIGIFLLILCVGVYCVSFSLLETVDHVEDDTHLLEFDAEHSITNNNLVIRAWVLKPGCATQPCDVRVILWNEDASVGYILPTAIITRPDVTEQQNDGLNYDYSGCMVNVPLGRTDLPHGTYEIILSRWAVDRYYDCHTQQRIEV